MTIRPILASLHKHRIPALLIVLEIALTCGVLCNAVFMIATRMQQIHWSNSIAEDELLVISAYGGSNATAAADQQRNLIALRQLGGVHNAASISSMPLDGDPSLGGFTAKPEQANTVNTSSYFLGMRAPQTLGLHLLQGRLFTDAEYADGDVDEGGYQSTSHVVLITRQDAERLWPGQSALGKQLYAKARSWTVIGVVDGVLGMQPEFSGEGPGLYSSVFFPMQPHADMNDYILRVARSDQARVSAQAEALLQRLQPAAVVTIKPYMSLRDDYFSDERAMSWILLLVCVLMLAVTAFGIVGLTSFWVGQRRTQIGIRRALGATRSQIMQYFQTENLLLSGSGTVLGAAFAYALNAYLIKHDEAQWMPWYYLPVGMLVLWLLGQFATLGPALRAAAIAPVVAIRQP